MIGAMASIPVPHASAGPPAVSAVDEPLAIALLAGGVRVAVVPWRQEPGSATWQRLVRISAAPYNALDDFERLARLLREIAGHTS